MCVRLLRKTCPKRASLGGEAASIQPALVDPTDIFASNVAPAMPSGLPGPVANGSGAEHHDGVRMMVPLKLEGALDAANKRVVSAEKQVAAAATAQEFEDATVALDAAVRLLEKVAACAQRCALVAQSLAAPQPWDSAAGDGDRDAKRMRLDPLDGGQGMAEDAAAQVPKEDALE